MARNSGASDDWKGGSGAVLGRSALRCGAGGSAAGRLCPPPHGFPVRFGTGAKPDPPRPSPPTARRVALCLGGMHNLAPP